MISEEQCDFMFRKSTTEVMLALRVLMTLNIWDQPSKRTDSAQERRLKECKQGGVGGEECQG